MRWKNGEESIVRLADIKESHPVLVAKYAKLHNLENLPGLSWWVPYTLKREKRIISLVKKVKTVKLLEKYGVMLPRNAEEAIKLDNENNNTLWQDAIKKELENCEVAFEFLKKGKRPNPDYKQIRCHLIFDVKADLTRKARFVAVGHMTDPPSELTYSTVASRDSIRILLLMASLNGLKVLSADLQNAYLNALPREKVYFYTGPEFGNRKGCIIIVKRALYGLKTSGAAFRAKLAEDLRSMGYVSTLSDNDVYLKKRTKSDGFTYYEVVITYVDDIICIGKNPEGFMKRLEDLYKLKNGFEEPKTYLGMTLRCAESGSWFLSSESYVKNILRELELRLKGVNMKLPIKVTSPLPSNYRAEKDTSKLLDAEDVVWYQGLRWLVEIGRVDISYGVSQLSSYLVQPRKGHFKAALNIFSYLKKTIHYSLHLDPEYPDFSRFVPVDSTRWREFSPNAIEQVPNIEARGNGVILSAFVDADHAGDKSNRRSHTGILIFVNKAPILWVSKKQNTVETSSYGSELVVIKMATELIEGLRFKLRSFGIPVEGSSPLFCDN